MDKRFLLFTPILLALSVSCNKSNIDIPKSPFNDSYNRIGLKSEYSGNVEVISDDEYSALKTGIQTYICDEFVSKYTMNSEARDLKYAYFGSESSLISQCSLESRTSTSTRYANLVTIVNDDSKNQNQTSSGIIATESTTNTYTFDTTKTLKESGGYQVNVEKTINKEATKVTVDKTGTYAKETKEEVFGLKPYDTISKQYFSEQFKIFGNNVVYGKITVNNVQRYIIKEAYSNFDYYSTASGRKYKSCDNSFYEALLEKTSDDKIRFTNFRFYKEKLILSEAIDDTGIPVLYLAKPVLVEYTETKYVMEYNTLEDYTGNIPGPTQI